METFLLTKFNYDRAKSTVQVEWLEKNVDGEDVKYDQHSYGGSYIPSDGIVETLDSLRSMVSKVMGTDRDLREVADLDKKVAEKVRANYTAHLRDITVKQVSAKFDESEVSRISISCYVRGPYGLGSAVNLHVKTEGEIGIEDDLRQTFAKLSELVIQFVASHGKTQLEVFDQPVDTD